jgi:hypothetical protein
MINDGPNSGFQGSHILGKSFYNISLSFLDNANVGLTAGSQSRLGSNLKFNGVLQLENAGDSMWLQVAGHKQEHVREFNRLAYSVDLDNPQFAPPALRCALFRTISVCRG